MKTFDLVLMYYDKPDVLYNWLHRLFNQSDFLKFQSRAKVIICDSGTPSDKVQASLDIVIQEFPAYLDIIDYLRCETEEIRKSVSEGISPRPMAHAYNVACLDHSQADVVVTSNIGFVFSPKYFTGHVAEHLKNPRAVVLPARFDLFSDNYHSENFKLPWDELVSLEQNNIKPSGGWPDMSINRNWLRQVGGWDEWYVTIAPIDMDLGSRLTGKLDTGQPSEMLYPEKGHYPNLGLDFVRPSRQDFISLTCNTYPGHIAKEDPARQRGYEMGIKYYLENWGKIPRNIDRKPLKYEKLL